MNWFSVYLFDKHIGVENEMADFFADDIFKRISFNEKYRIFLQISLIYCSQRYN